jgi:hypothetical protein
MLVVEPVGDRDAALVPPAPITCLITSDEDHGPLARVEGEQRSVVAGAQLLHVVVTRALDRLDQRRPKRRTDLLQAIEGLGDLVPVSGPQ